MGILIDTDDFVGKCCIATDDYTDDHLNDYIDSFEKKFLVSLLGVELFDLFQADLVAQVPQTPRFISIFNEFFLDKYSCVFCSEGMKKMLTQMVYFEYVRDQSLKNTVSGTVQNRSELANQVPSFNAAIQRWNSGADTFRTIQWFICDDPTTYPEFNGQLIDYTSGI